MQAAKGRVRYLQRHLARNPRKDLGRQACCINYDVGNSDVEAILHENLVKESRRKADTNPRQILTTRLDAIHLYRDIWRYSRLFVWSDETGVPWRDTIRSSARKEFEQARFETDHTEAITDTGKPEIQITRLLLVGRDAVMQAKDKYMEQREKIQQQEAANVQPPL